MIVDQEVREAFIEDYASAWLARWWATGSDYFSPIMPPTFGLPASMFELWVSYDD
jgi:hypothetical protein